MDQKSKTGCDLPVTQGGRKTKKNQKDNLINPVLESNFQSRVGVNPQTERLIARLDRLMREGDAEVLATWIHEQSWPQISHCLTLQSVQEGSSNISALHGMALFLKERAPQGSFDYVVKAYVKAGCDVNKVCNDLMPRRRTRHGFTPLLLAVERQNPSLVKALIRAGANVNECDTAGYSPLHWAVYASLHIEGIEALVEAGADMNKCTENTVPPVLHVAVDECQITMVNFLLAKGVDVKTEWTYSVISEKYWNRLLSRYDCGDMKDYREHKKISTVGRAVRMRKVPVLSILLRHSGAKPSVDDLHFCILEGDTKVANIILKHMDQQRLIPQDRINGRWALHCLGPLAFEAKQNGEDPMPHTKELIQTYMKYGWDINSSSYFEKQTRCKRTLLMYAVYIAHFELIEFLLAIGAKCTVPSEESELIDLINLKELNLEDNALVFKPCYLKQIKDDTVDEFASPFHAAISQQDLRILLLLAESGADFSQHYGRPTKYISEFINEDRSRSLTVFERVLTFQHEDNSMISRIRMQNVLRSILAGSNIIINGFHIKLAMSSLNLLAVLEVLSHLPKDYSLKGFTVTTREIPALQWFFSDYMVEQDICPSIVIEMLNCFRSRGYDLNAYKNHERWNYSLARFAVGWVTDKHGTTAVFDYLMEIPEFDWNQYDGARTAIEQALRTCLQCDESHVEGRMYNIVIQLLYKGVNVDPVGPIVDLLGTKQVYYKLGELIKTLWWAGSDFTGFETFLMNKADLEGIKDDEREAIKKLQRWWQKIGKVPCLIRLATIAVRKSMKYQDFSGLNVSNSLKKLIADIPGYLYT